MQNCVISCRNTILNLSTHRIRSLRLSRELCEVILKCYKLVEVVSENSQQYSQFYLLDRSDLRLVYLPSI